MLEQGQQLQLLRLLLRGCCSSFDERGSCWSNATSRGCSSHSLLPPPPRLPLPPPLPPPLLLLLHAHNAQVSAPQRHPPPQETRPVYFSGARVSMSARPPTPLLLMSYGCDQEHAQNEIMGVNRTAGEARGAHRRQIYAMCFEVYGRPPPNGLQSRKRVRARPAPSGCARHGPRLSDDAGDGGHQRNTWPRKIAFQWPQRRRALLVPGARHRVTHPTTTPEPPDSPSLPGCRRAQPPSSPRERKRRLACVRFSLLAWERRVCGKTAGRQ